MAEFKKVLFQDCKIHPNMFYDTKLLECIFINCEVNEGEFNGAEFIKCDLSNLDGLTTKMLDGSIGDLETILPIGVDRPITWNLFIDTGPPSPGNQIITIEGEMLDAEHRDLETDKQSIEPSAVGEDQGFPTISITPQNLPFIANQALLYAQISRDQIEHLRGANHEDTIAKNRPIIDLLEILEAGCKEIAEEAGQSAPAKNFDELKKRVTEKAARVLELCENTISGQNGTILRTFSNAAVAGVSIGFLTLFGAPAGLATGGVFALMGIQSIAKAKN